MGKTVLVTRPEPGATRTAQHLRALGHTPLVLPLTEIISMPVDSAAGPFDAVAITSANALRRAPEPVLAPLLNLPCFVVGEATAQAARLMGFKHVISGDGDGVSLAHRITVSTHADARILYLTGRVRSPEFEQIARQTGRKILPLTVYDTVLMDYTIEYLSGFFQNEPIEATLLYSRKGAEAFKKIMECEEFSYLFEKTEFFCLSPNIAKALSVNESPIIRIAAKPDETALLELLRT
jgi:uroporphyrinogen-III synthase